VSGATGLFGSRIGIGTTAPSHNLEVTGNIKANSLTIGTDTIYEKSINLHNDGKIRIGNTEMIDKVGNDLELYQGKLNITNGGNIGVGVADPSHKLYVSGEVAGTGAGSRITLNGLPYLLSGDSIGFTGLSSSDVTSALGYTPVDPSTTGALLNDNDIADFITGINSSNVTSALGYTPVDPSTTGALVNNNDIANFVTDGGSPTFSTINLQSALIHDGDTNTRFDFGTDQIDLSTAGLTRFVVQSDGNIGIGTQSVSNLVSVYGEASIGTSYHTIDAPSNGLIVQGDVGVGSSHPAAKLHVSGAIKGGFHISEKSSDFTLAAAENGSFINGTSTSFDQISITSDLGSDFNCSVMHSTSDVDIVASSSMIINGVTNGTVTLASGYQPASIVRIASNSYAVFGNLI
jgi:hypothetical protein